MSGVSKPKLAVLKTEYLIPSLQRATLKQSGPCGSKNTIISNSIIFFGPVFNTLFSLLNPKALSVWNTGLCSWLCFKTHFNYLLPFPPPSFASSLTNNVLFAFSLVVLGFSAPRIGVDNQERNTMAGNEQDKESRITTDELIEIRDITDKPIKSVLNWKDNKGNLAMSSSSQCLLAMLVLTAQAWTMPILTDWSDTFSWKVNVFFQSQSR